MSSIFNVFFFSSSTSVTQAQRDPYVKHTQLHNSIILSIFCSYRHWEACRGLSLCVDALSAALDMRMRACEMWLAVKMDAEQALR